MIEIQSIEDNGELDDFVQLRTTIYRREGLRLPGSVEEASAIFRHQTPFSEGRQFHPLVARQDGRPVARGVALVDERYCRHWNERIGHLIMFEALQNSSDACRALVSAAGRWLAAAGCRAIRAGFGPLEPGFVIDAYEDRPLRLMRLNPPYYHALLRDAGFEVEKGAGEYLVKPRPEAEQTFRELLGAAQAKGYDIVSLASVHSQFLLSEFTRTWNAAYKDHWGLAPVTEAEYALLLTEAQGSGTLNLSALAYRNGQPVGVVLVRETPPSEVALRWEQRRRSPSERDTLPSLAVGVVPQERGRGLAGALTAHAFIELMARGAQELSYGLVLDDNRTSREVADKLGARVAASYLTYRLPLGAPA